MQSKNKLAERRSINEQYARQRQTYERSLGQHALMNAAPGSYAPQPTTLDSPDIWLMYSDLVRLEARREALEAAFQRCVNSVDYLLKLIIRNSVNINGKDQWRTLVFPYEHCQNQTRIDMDNLKRVEIFSVMVEHLALQIFDYTGGEYSACYVESIDEPVTDPVASYRFYFVK